MRLAGRPAALAALLLLAAATVAAWLWKSDERKVVDLLEQMTQAATNPTAQSRAVLLAGLEPEVNVATFRTEREHVARDEFVAQWLRTVQSAGPLYVELRGATVTVKIDVAQVRGEALVSRSQPDDIHAAVHPWRVTLRKHDDEWRVRSMLVEEGQPALPEARP